MCKIVVIVVIVFVVGSLDVVGSVDAEDDVGKVVADDDLGDGLRGPGRVLSLANVAALIAD